MPAVIIWFVAVGVLGVLVSILLGARIWNAEEEIIPTYEGGDGKKTRTRRYTLCPLDEGGWGFLAVGIICIVIGFGLFAHFKVRSVKCDMINAKLGTNYTHEECFWGGSVIESMLEGTYEREQLDGNINATVTIEQGEIK